MGNEVYANNMELACKSGQGKSICAFPDVCFTPPLTPATPPGVPIPYPNTGMASDTTDGSKTVQITGKEVMLKNKSYFKKSTGDEAGSAPKKGVITSKNMGKVYFNAWSMDVKFEGENVVRNLDITTHNHASFPGNSPTWPFLDAADFAGSGDCADLAEEIKKNCLDVETKGKNTGKLKEDQSLVAFTKKSSSTSIAKREAADVKRKESMEAMCDNDDCKEALKCVLTPYSPSNCCDDLTGHHVVPKSQFKDPGEGGKEYFPINSKTGEGYNPDKAPCICVDGTNQAAGDHGEIHRVTSEKTRTANNVPDGESPDPKKRWTCGEAEQTGAEAVEEVIGCDADCTKKQLRKGHKDMGVKANDKVRPTTPGPADEPDNNTSA
jgi:hypothetical protein